MRITLFVLFALAGSAAASHDMCAFKQYGHFTDSYFVTLHHSNEIEPIMNQKGEHSVSSKIQTFKNGRGRVDINTDGGWSAAFDGYDWGGYRFLAKHDWGKKSVAWGCYTDKAGPNYCSMAKFEACKKRHGAI
ncbi:MAG: hypothetical protein JOS17DRAFT_758982 [Linnemannia elongata]|nr:MAG: hypothetical protein JOS17DRAFT_758982 [Linnemannia elongata]